jgi:hypothetical protein
MIKAEVIPKTLKIHLAQIYKAHVSIQYSKYQFLIISHKLVY